MISSFSFTVYALYFPRFIEIVRTSSKMFIILPHTDRDGFRYLTVFTWPDHGSCLQCLRQCWIYPLSGDSFLCCVDFLKELLHRHISRLIIVMVIVFLSQIFIQEIKWLFLSCVLTKTLTETVMLIKNHSLCRKHINRCQLLRNQSSTLPLKKLSNTLSILGVSVYSQIFKCNFL